MSKFFPLDAELPALTLDGDGSAGNDYTLNAKTAWINVGNLVVYISKGEESVSVDICPIGNEMEDPIAGTWATYSEGATNEP